MRDRGAASRCTEFSAHSLETDMYGKLSAADWATALRIIVQLVTLILVLLRTERELREAK